MHILAEYTQSFQMQIFKDSFLVPGIVKMHYLRAQHVKVFMTVNLLHL